MAFSTQAPPTGINHPAIGGKYTVCILGYGDHFELMEKCVRGIREHIPSECLDIRIALNQVCDETRKYCEDLLAKKIVTKLYPDTGSRRKYKAMREMFYDKEHPITTKYTLWFDDDASVHNKLWLNDLSSTIVMNEPHGVVLYGLKFYHDLNTYRKNGNKPETFFQSASWWRNKELRLKNFDKTATNGSCIDFVAGWFWAIKTEAIYLCDIPDVRLNHNGGDITIGAQVHQAGFRIKDFNRNKVYVWCPKKEHGGRRGYHEAFPWADKPGQP